MLALRASDYWTPKEQSQRLFGARFDQKSWWMHAHTSAIRAEELRDPSLSLNVLKYRCCCTVLSQEDGQTLTSANLALLTAVRKDESLLLSNSARFEAKPWGQELKLSTGLRSPKPKCAGAGLFNGVGKKKKTEPVLLRTGETVRWIKTHFYSFSDALSWTRGQLERRHIALFLLAPFVSSRRSGRPDLHE